MTCCRLMSLRSWRRWSYSNLGVGLVGEALAERAKMPYSSLVREQITEPMGLSDAASELSTHQWSRLLQGYDDRHRQVHEWNFDAFAGAGGLRSSAGDMLRYLEANLHPESSNHKKSTLVSSHGQTDQSRFSVHISVRV